MSEIFISYARSTEAEARRVEAALRALGHEVWRDDQIGAHQSFGKVLEERLAAARVVLVLWSADAAGSEWVRSEASRARAMGKLVQLTLDRSPLPMPFDQIQFADLSHWTGEADDAGWRKVVDSIADLLGGAATPSAPGVGTATSPAPALPSKPSIAVLPFTDMAGGKDQDYFADGMVEEIVTSLSRFQSLFVIAAGSSLTYRDTLRSPAQIAQELGVRYLLDGSVRKAGERVRITVKLTDAAAGAPLWTERFDGGLADVFELQDSVANAVAAQVAPTVEAAELRRAHDRPTSNLSAYDLLLRARHLWRVWDKEALREAIGLLEQAVARDPDFALAYALAANLHTLMAINGWSEDRANSVRLGLDFARQAMRAGAEDPEVLTYVAASIMQSGGDITTADALQERALALNPGSSLSWFISGWCKLYTGRQELAISRLETSLRMDPRSGWRPVVLAGLGFATLFQRCFEDAIPLLLEAVELRPSLTWALHGVVAANAHLGRLAEARRRLADVGVSSAIYIESLSGLFRNPGDLELLRSGLALAGADV